MIVNVVPLPKRSWGHGDVIDTLQPWCRHKEAIDAPFCFGNVGAADGVNQVNKYKIIDKFGTFIIERIVISFDPLDMTKKWWKSHMPIFTVWSKTYGIPMKPTAMVHRYVNGSTVLSGLNEVYPTVDTTIFNPIVSISKRTEGLGDEWFDGNEKYLSKIVDGNDDDRLRYLPECQGTFNDFNEMYTNDQEDAIQYLDFNMSYFNGALPIYTPDPYRDLYMNPIQTTDLSYALKPGFYPTPVYMNEVNKFDVTPTCQYSVSDYGGRLRDCIYAVESSGYTDIFVKLMKVDGNPCRKVKMYNTYIGEYSPIYTSNPDFVKETNRLLDYINNILWQIIGSELCADCVSFIKTWNEEVFIEVQKNGKIINVFYYDLVAISAISPLLVNQQESIARSKNCYVW